jgi:EAL domain-containing protein (putative c-di-GMP-specific phosphodiesterase class I)
MAAIRGAVCATAEFIPLAEESGRSRDRALVLRQACDLAVRWQTMLPGDDT